MCAIVGIMSKRKQGLTHKEYAAFKEAWVRAEDRGRHAAGFVVGIGENIWFGKAEGPASQIADDLPKHGNIRWAFAHTRWATHGSPSENINNHPIITGPDKDLIGIHNGVITNKESLLREHGWEAGREVDSEIAFRLVHHYGPESIKALNKIRGAANLCYARRSQPDRFWLTRLDNPLSVKENDSARMFGSQSYYWRESPGKLREFEDGTLERWTPRGVIRKVIRKVERFGWEDVERDPSGRPIERQPRVVRSQGYFASMAGAGRWEIDEETGAIVHVLD